MYSHSALFAAAVTGALLALPASAAPQPSKFTWTGLEVIDSKAFLSGWQGELNHGARLSFTLHTTKQAQEFIKKGFRIRFFRADENWNPLPYQKGDSIPYVRFPPCDIYLSGVWTSVTLSGDSAQYGRLENPGWLSAGATSQLQDGRWLLIFESKEGSNDSRVLRLDAANKTAYFALAARLVVRANQTHYTTANLPIPSAQDINTLKAEAVINEPSRYCLHLKKFTDAEPTTLAQLRSCIADAIQPG